MPQASSRRLSGTYTKVTPVRFARAIASLAQRPVGVEARWLRDSEAQKGRGRGKHSPLVLEGNPREERIIIGGVLVSCVVAHDDELDLLHVDLLVHLEGAAVDYVRQERLVLARVVLVLVEEGEDLVAELVALLEARVVRADEHQAEVQLLEADVDVEHVFLGAAGHADGRPRLPVLHTRVRHDEVEDHLDVCGAAMAKQSGVSGRGRGSDGVARELSACLPWGLI